MRIVKGAAVVFFMSCLFMVAINVSLMAGVVDYKGKVKSVDHEAKKITITTDAGQDITLNVDDKTKVTIIDIDGAQTKADIGSILSIGKDGADKADSAEITADDSTMLASKINATTTRRMTLTKEEIASRTKAINEGNKKVADTLKLKVENPGVIKGSVRVMARTSEDALVYIENINANNFTPTPKQFVPSGEANVLTKGKGSASEYPLMDQVNITFTPHVLPIIKGSVVDFPNSDTVRHNVFSPDPIPGTSEKINLGIYDIGVIKTLSMKESGELSLLCNVHAEMSGYIVAVDNPYFVLTDRKGEFIIENVPPGKYTLKTWHERFKPVTAEVTVEPGQTAEVKLPTMKEKK